MLGYGAMLALAAVVFVWALIDLRRLGQASDAILRENYKSILAAENMMGALERQDGAALLLILGFEEEALAAFRENEAEFFQSLARAKDNITIAGEEKIVSAIEESYSGYLAEFSQLRDQTKGAQGQVADFYHAKLRPSFLAVRGECVRLRELNQETMFRASDRAAEVAQRALWSIALIGAAAVLAGGGFSLFLTRLLVRPLHQLTAATRQVGEGDYSVEVPPASNDELGMVASEFSAMVRKLKAYHDLNVSQIMREKRKAEAILRSMDDAIVVVDEESRIANMNPAAASLFGADRSEAKGSHFLEVIKDEQLFSYVKETAESGEAPAIEEGRNVLTFGREQGARHYLYSVVPVRVAGEGLQSVVIVLRDVTRLKELDRLKSEFVMTASHELRTPLTTIGMALELLQEHPPGALTGDQKNLLTAALEETQRMKAIVSELLDLSKMEAGRIEMQFAAVPVDEVVKKALSVLAGQGAEKGIELSCHVPKGIPSVRADDNKISWVLINLIANALRHTDRGGHIRVAAEGSGAQVYISVTDDGAGIPQEHQAMIFDKFVKVGRAETEGTGLGLAICKEIIRAHGGTIWVESKLGEGSKFTFTVPVAKSTRAGRQEGERTDGAQADTDSG
jgi:NtrC-family two-component system sensor histidine kinase KinB